MKARNTLLSIVAAALMAVGMSSCGAYSETYVGPGAYVSASAYYPYYYPGYIPPRPPRPIIVNRPMKPGPGVGPSITPTPGQKPPISSAPSKPNTPSTPSIPAAPAASQRPGANITNTPSITNPSVAPGVSSIRPGSGASTVRPGAIRNN